MRRGRDRRSRRKEGRTEREVRRKEYKETGRGKEGGKETVGLGKGETVGKERIGKTRRV